MGIPKVGSRPGQDSPAEQADNQRDSLAAEDIRLADKQAGRSLAVDNQAEHTVADSLAEDNLAAGNLAARNLVARNLAEGIPVADTRLDNLVAHSQLDILAAVGIHNQVDIDIRLVDKDIPVAPDMVAAGCPAAVDFQKQVCH